MINRKYDDGDVNTRVIVTDSTGVAAANIDRLTIHQILKLDCQQSGYLNSKPLSEKKKQELRTLFAFVRYIITFGETKYTRKIALHNPEIKSK